MAFVVLVGMIREGVADLQRWREDKHTNKLKYGRLRSPHDVNDIEIVDSGKLKVGDVLEINSGQ